MSRSPYGGAYIGRPPYSGKFTREDVQEILAQYDAGHGPRCISRKLGVTHSAISYWILKTRPVGKRYGCNAGLHTPGEPTGDGNQRRQVTHAEHGTRARYQWERAHLGEACAECKAGNSADTLRRRTSQTELAAAS